MRPQSRPKSPRIVPGAAEVGIGRARERAEALDHAVPRDPHRDDRAGLHELDERLVERLALVLGVVRREQVAVGLQHPDVDEGVPLRLDAAQDLARQVAGDAIGFDDDEGLLQAHAGPPWSGDASAPRFCFVDLTGLAGKQHIQMAAKPAPTTYMNGTRMPRAMSTACSTQPIAIPQR